LHAADPLTSPLLRHSYLACSHSPALIALTYPGLLTATNIIVAFTPLALPAWAFNVHAYWPSGRLVWTKANASRGPRVSTRAVILGASFSCPFSGADLKFFSHFQTELVLEQQRRPQLAPIPLLQHEGVTILNRWGHPASLPRLHWMNYLTLSVVRPSHTCISFLLTTPPPLLHPIQPPPTPLFNPHEDQSWHPVYSEMQHEYGRSWYMRFNHWSLSPPLKISTYIDALDTNNVVPW